jgi:hypothetical protein
MKIIILPVLWDNIHTMVMEIREYPGKEWNYFFPKDIKRT